MKKPKHVWTCTCGQVIPKKDAHLSGYPNSDKGLHIHCPNCNKIVASFVNPKVTS